MIYICSTLTIQLLKIIAVAHKMGFTAYEIECLPCILSTRYKIPSFLVDAFAVKFLRHAVH